ncbi:MAG: hydroxymethylglutaryl-CoA synthase family protein [Desulfobacterales bacterium]|nr:hydroxymethylglutaryl-CoA synthase family protein [Desulfobacterales bacterium]
MVGITSFGAYIPAYRLSRDEISRAWGTRSKGGERAVAKHDEDSLTMAVAATFGCMKGGGQRGDGLFFASTTSPYKEKQGAAIIAAAVDLPKETRTADFTDSLRAATIAMNSAVDAVKSGTAENIIVAASDCRMGAGKSQFEPLFGEGAVALGIGNADIIASIEGSHSVFSELLDVWRLEGDSFTRSWEERFIINEGYMNTMQRVISQIMEKYKVTPKDFSKVVFYGPDRRSHTSLARRLGFDLETQVQDPLFDSIGNTGTAALPMMMVAALDEAKPGDLILVANYGDGGDAFIMKVTANIGKFRGNQKIKELLEKKININYEKYLNWRDLVPIQELSRPQSPTPSITCLWRESKSVLAFYGKKCKKCGTAQYPPQRVCIKCQTKDDFEDYKFSDKKGNIFTYTLDYLTPSRESPAVVGVVDFEGGGRVMCEVTECEPSKITIGMPVEMCFRKIGLRGGVHNYFWKARPIS